MDFVEALSLREISANVFEGKHPPEAMGNALAIAYGGYTIATAISAAYRTVDASRLRLYSAQGAFLGPASTAHVLRCTVRDLRSTKSFATRLVEVSQAQDAGPPRVCLTLLADFHVLEPRSLLEYSVPQPASPAPDACPTPLEWARRLVDEGKVTPRQASAYETKFGVSRRYFEGRMCPEGVGSQRLLGLAKTAPTTQDGRDLTDRTSMEWTRCQAPLRQPAEHAVAISFLMDAAIAFIPLTHSGMFLDDAGACSTLDFSLRFFETDLDFNTWHLRQLKTMRGSHARTFSEGRLFQGGKLIASMTQQSIMRPKPERQSSL